MPHLPPRAHPPLPVQGGAPVTIWGQMLLVMGSSLVGGALGTVIVVWIVAWLDRPRGER